MTDRRALAIYITAMPADATCLADSAANEGGRNNMVSYTTSFCNAPDMVIESPPPVLSPPAMASATIGTIREGRRS